MPFYFEDFEVGSTERFGSHEVTREEVIAFASRYDPQPFHLSDEGAADTIFGQLAASGWHTTAITMGMMVRHWQSIPGQQEASVGGMGLEGLRWLLPVYPGDVLRCETMVTEKSEPRSMPTIGIVKTRVSVFNQKDQKVLEFTPLGLWKKRPPGQ
ncbi:MaoC family dehydratase [Sphingobium subterraneum]|uniref:Acyl dehydratase n=1 Tax=Sphingobium subterraneum TaxID=627688 RepID=A0A841IXB9_9SPHN|nr:MaoC family dehydratase [Sphingobium subterraneum]MBB6122792.1 acyl dehydratase [Sphingobium subterraneum]